MGATHQVVNMALEYVAEKCSAETRYFHVRGKKLEFCIHCDYCVRKKQGCVHRDDMGELYELMKWADAWVIGTPVYQGTLSAQTKTVMDRCRALAAANPRVFLNKVGAGIAIGGDRSGGQEPALQTITDFYLINEMIPVGGGSFGANLGGVVWSRDEGVEGAKRDEVGLRSVYKTMDRLVDVVSCLGERGEV
jgi:multimeric flavodoxin WrbA